MKYLAQGCRATFSAVRTPCSNSLLDYSPLGLARSSTSINQLIILSRLLQCLLRSSWFFSYPSDSQQRQVRAYFSRLLQSARFIRTSLNKQEDMAQSQQPPKNDKSVESAYFVLRSNHRIPALGLGTWKAETNVVRDAVYQAVVEYGYRHLDCAHIYGNEEEVGEGLKAAFDAGIKREDIFVTSKLWVKSCAPEKVKAACETTLSNLGLTYLDLYLIHWPVHQTEDASSPPKKGQVLPFDSVGVWKEMEKLVDRGLVRDIGISNFSVPKIEKLISACSIMPAVNQVEMHPSWRNDKILAYCKKNDIHVTAYSPLGSSSTDLFHAPEVTETAEKLGKSPGQIMIRWLIQKGASTIPKSSNEKRIKENMEVFDWSIPAEDMETLSNISPQKRTNPGEEVFVTSEDENEKRAALEEFWDGEV